MSIRHIRRLEVPPHAYRLPIRGALGLVLVAVAWAASWLKLGPLGEYSFFPLWLGYILTIDALVFRRKGTSLLTRSPVAFGAMFLASVPLWWFFEGINHFTQNWHYLGAEDYPPLQYVVVASWNFSIVIPAVFETAELVGSFAFMRRFRRVVGVSASSQVLTGAIVMGLLCFLALLLWPRYAFPATWLCLSLLLDPINYLQGRPSVVARLRLGDWRLVVALGVGAVVCGWFWEMWNYWAFPKWEYSVSLVDFVHVFEMPLLGYAGYVPFGLEVYAVYHFLTGLVGRVPKGWLRFAGLAKAGHTSPKPVDAHLQV